MEYSSTNHIQDFPSPSFFHPTTTTTTTSFPNPPPPPIFLDSLSYLNSPPPPPPPPLIQPNSSSAATTASRNSKKRSRASRRAPTTVLTTDTSNFRAMVQEFTGIPSPPFPSSSRSLFDFFRSSSTLSPPIADPPFLLRPFPHKLHSPTFTTSTATNTTNSSINYQLPSFHPPTMTSQIQTFGLPSNYVASASTDFNADKGSETVGMVESWICSSD